jgi:hypothetical protein
MWKITTRGFTLHEVLIMTATNVASDPIATDKNEQTTCTAPAPRFNKLQEDVHGKGH